MVGRRAQPITLASIGKGIYSALFFPFNVAVTAVAYVGKQCAEYGNFIAAFFTKKDSWLGRSLKEDPIWKSMYEKSKMFFNSVTGLTFFAGTEPLRHANEVSTAAIRNTTPSVLDHNRVKVDPSDKDIIKNQSRPSTAPHPESYLSFIAKVVGLNK